MAKRKNSRLIIFLLLALVAILIVAMAIKARSKPKGEKVEISKVEKRTIKELVSASGKIFPETEVKISSDVSGEIVELFVEDGDSIKVGQVLAKIDPESYVAQVARAQASLDGSRSEVSRSKSSLQTSIAQKEQILAQLVNARKIHERNKQLLADGVISQQDFENSESNVQQLEANLRSAEASYKAAEEAIKGAEFSVKSAMASLNEIKTAYNRTTIVAPINGVISSLLVEQGERVVGTIQMTGTEMMRVANFNDMEVQVEVSENDILRVSHGDTAEIEVDAYLDKTFTGIVTEIGSSATNTTGSAQVVLTSDQVTNFIVKIRIIPDSYADLMEQTNGIPFRPGMSASVDINTHTESDILSIPIQAVTTREKDDVKGKKVDREEVEESDLVEVVFVMDADTAKMVNVKTGIQDNEFIQITEGLDEDQEVVIGPYSAISRKLENGTQLERKKDKDDEDEKSD